MSERPRITGPASYFPSIEKKYGQPIEHWLNLLKSLKGMKHMEMVKWLKTGAVIVGQLLESQRKHDAIGSEANRTQLERGGVPTSVSGTAIGMGFETDPQLRTCLKTIGLRSTRE